MAAWHEEAVRLRLEGWPLDRIATQLKRSPRTVQCILFGVQDDDADATRENPASVAFIADLMRHHPDRYTGGAE